MSSPYSQSANDKKMREKLNDRFDRLREMIYPAGSKASQKSVLYRAVEMLTGQAVVEASNENVSPPRDRKERRKNAEKSRRDDQGAGYEALKLWIRDQRLGTDAQRERLEKVQVLDIVLEQLRGRQQREEQPPLPFSISTILADKAAGMPLDQVLIQKQQDFFLQLRTLITTLMQSSEDCDEEINIVD